jgi:hypothetical protein
LNRRDLAQGTLLMCAVVLIWGAFLPVSKVVLPVVDPYWLTLLRYGVAAVCFLVALACLEGRRAFALEGRAATAWAYGSAGFAGFSLFVYEGLRLTRPEHGAMILALGPVNIVLWQWLRTRHRPHAATLACIGDRPPRRGAGGEPGRGRPPLFGRQRPGQRPDLRCLMVLDRLHAGRAEIPRLVAGALHGAHRRARLAHHPPGCRRWRRAAAAASRRPRKACATCSGRCCSSSSWSPSARCCCGAWRWPSWGR